MVVAFLAIIILPVVALHLPERRRTATVQRRNITRKDDASWSRLIVRMNALDTRSRAYNVVGWLDYRSPLECLIVPPRRPPLQNADDALSTFFGRNFLKSRAAPIVYVLTCYIIHR